MTPELKEIKKYILGETDKEFVCVNNQHTAFVMLKQIELRLDILSRDFDPDIYNNIECREAIEDLALRSRYSRIRILLQDTKTISQRGHLILYLGRRLGNMIQFRSLNSFSESFMIADGIGIMHKTAPLASIVNFKDRPTAKKLSKIFEDHWENATPDPNTRDMVI